MNPSVLTLLRLRARRRLAEWPCLWAWHRGWHAVTSAELEPHPFLLCYRVAVLCGRRLPATSTPHSSSLDGMRTGRRPVCRACRRALLARAGVVGAEPTPA
jgi:hypothetical protein